MTSTTGRTTGDEYTVRRYDPSDLTGLMALDRAVWDRRRSAEWFAWKYAENPYVDHVPIFVVERDDEIVGARPIQPFRVQGSEDSVLALQPSDTMVHPDHRRRGLFTRMTRHAIDFYEGREPDLFFNFPNEQAYKGYRKLGWEPVAQRRAYYRIQTPTTFLQQSFGTDVGSMLGAVWTPMTRGYYRVRRTVSGSVDRFDVTRRPGVDPQLLADVYEKRPPDVFHAQRDREFYEWQLSSPAWDHHTVVARDGDEIVAVLVTRTRTTDDGVTVTQITEVLPLGGGERWTDAVSALLDRTIEAASDADLISVVQSGIPDRVLASHGLYPGNEPPIEFLRGSSSTFVVRPIDPDRSGAWEIDGRDLTDRDNWILTFCEHDTA